MRLASVLVLIVISASVVARSPGGLSQRVERQAAAAAAEPVEDGAQARSTNGTQTQKPDKKTVLMCMMKPFGGACPQDRNGTKQWRPMQEAAWRMFQGWMGRMTDTMGTIG